MKNQLKHKLSIHLIAYLMRKHIDSTCLFKVEFPTSKEKHQNYKAAFNI